MPNSAEEQPQTEPTRHQLGESTPDALKEAKRLMAIAEAHERRVALREESARFLDERGEDEGAERERREADLERDAARTAWDRAMALQGPTQMTEPKNGEPLEIPIPTREDFIANMRKVAPKPSPQNDQPPQEGPLLQRRE